MFCKSALRNSGILSAQDADQLRAFSWVFQLGGQKFSQSETTGTSPREPSVALQYSANFFAIQRDIVSFGAPSMPPHNLFYFAVLGFELDQAAALLGRTINNLVLHPVHLRRIQAKQPQVAQSKRLTIDTNLLTRVAKIILAAEFMNTHAKNHCSPRRLVGHGAAAAL